MRDLLESAAFALVAYCCLAVVVVTAAVRAATYRDPRQDLLQRLTREGQELLRKEREPWTR